MTVHVGDKIRIESERAGQSGRAGLIEEVLSEQPQRLRVRWEDGSADVLLAGDVTVRGRGSGS